MSKDSLMLSIILPAFNEGHRLLDSLQKIMTAVAGVTSGFEIIIVDDGSSDDTLAKAKSMEGPAVKVIGYAPNKGKGYAVKKGILAARGRYRLFMDVDLATSLESIGEFVKLIEAGNADIIIGDRKSDMNRQIIPQPFSRQFFGAGFTMLSRLLLNCRVNDFTCGCKLFTDEACETVFSRQRIDRWAFDSEILFIAQKHGLRILESPVIWRHQHNSKVRLFKDIFTSLMGLLEIRLNDAKGLYQ